MYIADAKRLTHDGARRMMATAIDEAHKAKERPAVQGSSSGIV